MVVRYLVTFTTSIAVSALVAVAGHGQSPASSTPAEQIARGDSLYREIKVQESLDAYAAVLAADSSNVDALWRASRNIADLAEYEPNGSARKERYVLAEQLARRAIALRPTEAEAHFDLARALGRVALSVGKKDRVKYAKEIRNHALEALRIAPEHPGALHVMGVWNAEVMRLSGITRWMAKNFLGGRIFDEASWPRAIEYMEHAARVDPVRLVHKLDLAEIYLDVGEKAKAREQLEAVINGKRTELNDERYQRKAEEMLRKLK
ncbi:MAG TPA: hypothetical protein VJ812_14795 [Gemmatimonadaceae bacterium]|jgi:FimV-like protein|nr:hypothetical protein [Gemmatimonadaceae bacterium]